MKLCIASLLVGTAAATSSSIRANSKVGQKVLSKARRLNGDDGNMQWATNYSLRFEKCATTTDYYGGYFGGNQNNQNNNNANNNRAGYNGVYEQRLVHFKLCPTSECGSGSCTNGGDYVMEMNEFVEAYLEYKVEAMEAECESVAANCYCENANDDEVCEAQCYKDAGIYDNCVEADNQNENDNNNGNNGQQEEEFDLQEAMQCRRLDIDEDATQYYNYGNNGNNMNYYNGNNNNNNGQQEIEFFVGPYCSANGKSILLGTFMDETCSFEAPEGVYEKFNYGKALPYSSESLVSNDCISCKQVNEDENNNNNENNENNQNNQNNNNQNYQQEEAEVTEVCERLYEDAGKCEAGLANVYGLYPDTFACDFIKGLNPWGKTRIANTLSAAKASVTPQVLAGLFAVTTLAFGGVALYFHKKLQRNNVGLVSDGSVMA